MPTSRLKRDITRGGEMIPLGWWHDSKVKPYKIAVFSADPEKGDSGPPWTFTLVQPSADAPWFLYRAERGY